MQVCVEARAAWSRAMLGIASLRAGGADYYLEVVASGREDYYLGSGEAVGYWLGAHATTLGLDGDVAPEHLHALLDGDDPQSGLRLARTRARRTPGFDLTFSAPKSVSIMYALARPELGRQVRYAHGRAVAATIGWLEANACTVRRGAGGAVTQAGDGFVAAAFRHRTSRAGDPHLHTHVLVANLTRGPDGHWSAPDGRRLWALGNTASYLYEAALRHEMTRTLGLKFDPVANGIADLSGIPRDLIETFSQRRARDPRPPRRTRPELRARRPVRHARHSFAQGSIRRRRAAHRLGRDRLRLRDHGDDARTTHRSDTGRRSSSRVCRDALSVARERRWPHCARVDVRPARRHPRVV